jgi:hypothetical protein
MPEFVMEGLDHAARAESDFVLGFIEALFWTSCSPVWDSEDWFSDECRADQEAGAADGELPGDVGYYDLHPDSLAAIRADCEAWQAENAELLAFAFGPMSGYSEHQAGIDYFLTRNGHGAGFWDREELRRDMARRSDGSLTDTGEEEGLPFLESLGEMLANACRYRETYAFFGNHVTYGDAPFVHVDL